MSLGYLPNHIQFSNSSEMTGTKATLLNRFDELRKWREEQVQQLRAEQQKQLQQLQEEQKRVGALMDQHRGNIKSTVDEKVFGSHTHDFGNTSAASFHTTASLSNPEVVDLSSSDISVCHDLPYVSHEYLKNVKVSEDTPINPGISGNVNSFEDLIEQQMKNQHIEVMGTSHIVPGNKSKPKRPFLKKGSGLQRFMCRPISYPKSNKLPVKKTETRKTVPVEFKLTLPLTSNLRPANQKNATCVEIPKSVHFDVSKPQDLPKPPVRPFQSSPKSACAPKQVASVYESKTNESGDSLKERQELFEFEILEKAAQNCSFSSDSSVVQKLLKQEPFQPSDILRLRSKIASSSLTEQSDNKTAAVGEKLPENFAETANLHEILEAVKSRKELLEKKILEVQPRLVDLGKEPFDFSRISYDLTETGDLTIDDVISDHSDEDKDSKHDEKVDHNDMYQNGDRNTSSILSDDDTNFQDLLGDSSIPSGIPPVPDTHSTTSSPILDLLNEKEGLEPEREKSLLEHEADARANKLVEDATLAASRLKLQEKMQELEQEIDIFHAQNAELKSLKKQREEALQKLLKEREEFEQYQSNMKNKMEKEFTEEKRQFRRQKQTFERYQKLRKDLPGKKEREEITLLRQEVNKLQEEMKKQEIKWSSEFRRLRLQLTNTEKERDSLKVENQRLEEQRIDLLALLKEKKNKSTFDQPTYVPVRPVTTPANVPSALVKETKSAKMPSPEISGVPKEGLIGTKKYNVNSALHGLTSNASIDSLDTDEERFVDSDHEDTPLSAPVPQKHHVRFNLEPQVSQSEKKEVQPDFKETHYRDRVDRIYKNGEIETVFTNGTRKHTSADGLNTIFYYYNGDTKEIFPDKRIVYKYADGGTTQTVYPDGLEVIEYSNGQVERLYRDGMKHITFSDGTQHIVSPDGAEEIQIPEGTVVKVSADGTESIHFANGEKEIKSAEYIRHEYLNGTVKTVYKSGRQETRYASGRIRIKDRHGNVIVDTKHFGTELAPVRLQDSL